MPPRPSPPEPTLGAPLRITTFRNLLLANLASDIGAFMQSVGAAWLMVSFGAGPKYVALTQTASALPFFLLALPAGSIGDIVDRRKLILFTETWMVICAAVLAVLTMVGVTSPWLLLVLTFAISAGDAFESPSWRALLPDLVPREDLAAASALNGIEFNLARALGPALAGVLIASTGAGAAFLVNALSFAGVILVIARWRPHARQGLAPAETVGGATVAALRYVRHSPEIRTLTYRSGIVMFFASATLALLPLVARRASESPLGYGLLLGCFGVGAVLGALLIQPARARWSLNAVVSWAVGVFGATVVGTGALRGMAGLAAVMLVGGGAWIIFLSLLAAAVQNLAPDWVRARVLAVFMLFFQGGVAAGSALWGSLAERLGIERALVWAGLGTVAAAALGLLHKLPESPEDVAPWIHWRLPTLAADPAQDLDDGPVLVSVEYIVKPQEDDAFLHAMHEQERVRRRDGASRWGIYHDVESADRYVESFIIATWAEHVRQHARQIQADRQLEDRIQKLVQGSPRVRHFLYARPRKRR